uniref:Uncharacterized protein n=1 Tax=Leviviridae sp. TaxID=2027243 RepID=A0A514DB59_9VIRU|nr:MAG: hypothetical protein H2Bulk36332_000003 [Leviviridae sp.]
MNPGSRWKRLLDEANRLSDDSVVETVGSACYFWFVAAGVVGLTASLLGLLMPASIPVDGTTIPIPSEPVDSSLLESCLVHRSPVPDCQRCGERPS